jgi:hypothetical protein
MLKERGQLMAEKKEEKPATTEAPKTETEKPVLPGPEIPKVEPATTNAPASEAPKVETKTNAPAPASEPKK